MVFAPSIVNIYASDIFPTITDAIYSYKKMQTNELLDNIKLQYSAVIHSLQSASSILKESHNFKRYVF